jgi:folate-binding protein YgfZ
MTSAVQTTNRLVLEEIHSRLGATMKLEDGWSVPASYGDKAAEYDAVRKQGVGLLDLSARGRLLVTGSEAVAFLNGLITNDLKTLAENRWMPAAFPNVQGRLVASVRVIRTADEIRNDKPSPRFLLDTEARTHQSVLSSLNRFTFAGDFQVTDLTGQFSLLSVQGKRASELIATVLGEAGEIEPNEVRELPWRDALITLWRATHTAEDGFDLLVANEDAETLWQAVVEAGARPIGFEALEVLRIEAGQARYGVDMDESNVVSETNLDEAISFTKGCYIGQEIIARIKYRGHVAKKLTGLIFDSEVEIQAGVKIYSEDEKEIGRLTSATFSPVLRRTIALGYVKYDYLEPGTRVVALAQESRISATVSKLPFIGGELV